MSTNELIDRREGVPDSIRASRTVSPASRSSRAELDVCLMGRSQELPRANLATLLRSPLGVYVARTEVLRDAVLVHFDIAPEDLAFTLHTLYATLPAADLGPVQYHELEGAC